MTDYDDSPTTLADFLTLENKVLLLEAVVNRLLARLDDADRRLEALDPGAASIDPRANLGRLPEVPLTPFEQLVYGGGVSFR